jgi:diaminopimelate epimerase
MHLTKHHGLGNDFIVLLDLDGTHPVTAALARAVCDRHRGIGADGLLHVTAPPVTGTADVTMTLYNADGGRAEMSGNGISCLAQAVVRAGLVSGPEVHVATDAGVRTVLLAVTAEPRTHRATVDMGPAKVGDEEPEWLGAGVSRAVRVEIGNPHLVLSAGDVDAAFDLEGRGREINDVTPGGINVELVAAGPGPDELTMLVYERGVGLTEACGTGACAAAVAAQQGGMSGPRVRVHQPGGAADVEIRETVALTVPVVLIATIEWPL